MSFEKKSAKKVVIVAATEYEIRPILHFLQNKYSTVHPYQFDLPDKSVHVLVTGIGSVQMAANTSIYYVNQKPDLALLAGIGGAYNADFEIGEAYLVVSEEFGDLGAEHSDKKVSSIFEMGLAETDQYPFTGGKLWMNPIPDDPFLRHAHGLTVNVVSGSEDTIRQRVNKFNADIESMEGAAFFYSSMLCNIPFLQIRAVSNYVEPRAREKWETEKAITRLNQLLQDMLHQL